MHRAIASSLILTGVVAQPPIFNTEAEWQVVYAVIGGRANSLKGKQTYVYVVVED